MSSVSVRLRFDECRPVTRQRSLASLPDGFRDGRYVHPVDGKSGDTVRLGGFAEILDVVLLLNRCSLPELVVLVHEDGGKVPRRREVDRLVDLSLRDRAVAEEGQRRGPRPSGPRSTLPRRDRRPGSDDSVRAEHAGVDVGDMHRSALAVAVSSVLPSSSAIM